MLIFKQTFQRSLALLMIMLALPMVVSAAQSSSANFQVNEVFFGSGGELNACSSKYCSKQSAGELVVGETCSNTFCAQGGFNTDRTPYIECKVTNTNLNLGKLDTATTKTAQTSFSVKAYLAHGYAVVNASDPPDNNGHQLTPIGPFAAAAAPGTEQFGMNLRANTNPTTFGADPQYTPDNTFSFGQVTPDYDTADVYKYARGDTIAFSTASSSDTTYTIAYIFNISPITPGGTYVMNHVLVATATY